MMFYPFRMNDDVYNNIRVGLLIIQDTSVD